MSGPFKMKGFPTQDTSALKQKRKSIIARFLEKINPFDDESKRKRQSKRSRRNIAKKNTWRN